MLLCAPQFYALKVQNTIQQNFTTSLLDKLLSWFRAPPESSSLISRGREMFLHIAGTETAVV